MIHVCKEINVHNGMKCVDEKIASGKRKRKLRERNETHILHTLEYYPWPSEKKPSKLGKATQS